MNQNRVGVRGALMNHSGLPYRGASYKPFWCRNFTNQICLHLTNLKDSIQTQARGVYSAPALHCWQRHIPRPAGGNTFDISQLIQTCQYYTFKLSSCQCNCWYCHKISQVCHLNLCCRCNRRCYSHASQLGSMWRVTSKQYWLFPVR